MSSDKVHFLDITSKLEGHRKSWSPNTLKTRMVLNYKGIPYTESFISYPDIRPLLTSYGITPDPSKSFEGYHLPGIYHPSSLKGNKPSEVVMVESTDIAKHLDEIFPEKKVFPNSGSEELFKKVEKLVDAAKSTKGAPAGTLALNKTPTYLDSRGSQYFHRTRTATHPQKLPPTEWGLNVPRDELWKKFEENIKPLCDLLGEGQAKGGAFFEGETFGYSDCVVVANLLWYERADPEYLKRIEGFNGGELGKLMEAVRKEGWDVKQGEVVDWPIPRGEEGVKKAAL